MPSTFPCSRIFARLAILAVASTLSIFGCAEREKPSVLPAPESATTSNGVETAVSASPGMIGRSSAALAEPDSRDWHQCPAIAEISSTGNLLVVGDVHGDWERLRDLLLGAEVISRPAPQSAPEEYVWRAEDATLVFVGDFTGKFSQSLEVIELINSLDQQANVLGGRVIATMGNHEAEFLAPKWVDGKPKWAKKTRIFRQELKSKGLDPKDVWLARGNERSRRLGEFLHCLPVAAVSDHWFFSHAGSTGGRALDPLRQAVEEGVRADGYRTAVLLDKATGLLEARLRPDPPSDVWWQKLPESQERSRQRLEEYAEALGVRHLVIGHQSGKYQFNRGIEREKASVFQLFDGTLFLVDVGMSRGQRTDLSTGALLQIGRQNDEQTVNVICPDGLRHPLPPRGTSKQVRCSSPE